MRKVLILFLFLAPAAFAQQPARDPFPADYKPHPCAPDVCETFERGRFGSAAHSFFGFTIDDEWVTKHWASMMDVLTPICRKAATCYTVHGATFQFCNDALMPEVRGTCNRFPKSSRDWDQCSMFVETWALGRDQRSLDLWRKTQACANEKTPFAPKNIEPIVWMTPEKLTPAFSGYLTFYALDPDTRTPVPAKVTIEGQKVYAPSNPVGIPWTYYPFKWPVKLNRVPNAQGHRDLVAPMVTVEAEGYTPVKFRMPVDTPKLLVSMTPAAENLRRGKNTIMVKTTDAESGKPVEMRVMMGDLILGESNKPIELELKRGQKRGEIWVTSLFDKYSDVVVAPAAKK